MTRRQDVDLATRADLLRTHIRDALAAYRDLCRRAGGEARLLALTRELERERAEQRRRALIRAVDRKD